MHVNSDALVEAAEIFGQAGAPGRLVGALEKLAKIQGLARDLINHVIGLFWGYKEMENINIVGVDTGVDTLSGGGERVLRAQRVALCCGVIGIWLDNIWWRTMERHPQGCW